MTARPGQHLIELTDKQAEVLAHMARGLGQPGIAREMQISVQTVRTHLRAAMERLGAVNGLHAVALAIGLGLLHDDVAITTNHARR